MKTLIKILCLSMLWFSCEEPTIHGYLDSQACNYSPDATIDNNSCLYAQERKVEVISLDVDNVTLVWE